MRSWDEFVEHFRSRLKRGRRKWNGTCCLEWTGAIGKHGYGNINYAGRWLRPHRLAWEIAHGSVPDGLLVLHHCDNKPCANALHLFLGTHKDNHDDMRSKGRESDPPRCAGVQNAQSKLNERQIIAIKKARARGVFIKTLAAKYGVAYQLISRISRGEAWSHVSGPTAKRTRGAQA